MRPFRSTLVAFALVTSPTLALGTLSPQASGDAATRDTTRKVRPPAVHRLVPITILGTRGYSASHITSATRTDTPVRETPQSISVVTHALISDLRMQSMSDVVRHIPGITMGQGEGHRDAPTIRGNSSTADFFVDGVRDDAQYLRDLYNVERVEALKGPNALMFGRGGAGGVLNRVMKEAQWVSVQSLTAGTGSFDHKRATLDVGQALSERVAGRFNGMFEESGGFRDAYSLDRYGVNPTIAIALGAQTTIRAAYELFSDERTVDRGIPSFRGLPSDADQSVFFGNPDVSYSTMKVQTLGGVLEHTVASGLNVRNRTRFADYDKFYQNSYPGALNAEGTRVTLNAYNNATDRRNLFNQTDIVYHAATGAVRHTLLLGGEVGFQETDNFRATGYYSNTSTTLSVPFEAPTVAAPITFRQSATDADHNTRASTLGIYVQDQLVLSSVWQVLAGLRYDRFRLAFRDHRRDQQLSRVDELLSPRFAVIATPFSPAAIYASYSMSHLPSSGDQFSSLTVTSQTLEPERFDNYEVGAKWDVRPNLALSAAWYQLDRTNTVAPDPRDASRAVQTGSQRTRGFELNATGAVNESWNVIGGLSFQRATITSTTAAAAAGATVPLVPERTASLWSRHQLFRALAAGVGVVHQSRRFAAIDNTVTLPAFTRADAALFITPSGPITAQVNVENVFDTDYYPTSHGNNNIMPGAPRTVRISLGFRQ